MKGITMSALNAYAELARKDHQVHRAEAKLKSYAGQIPDEDVEEYIRKSQEIETLAHERCSVCSKEDRDEQRLQQLEDQR